MIAAQLAFDFTVDVAAPTRPVAAPPKFDFDADARAHWRVGMVTSLPCFCVIKGGAQRYTQMLPGVVESIASDLASVRIYAAPEYGSTLDGYPLHLALAISVPLRQLGRHHRNANLQRIVDEGLLATGDAELAAEVRGRANFTHEREIARVA
jgi:hypothetical protein